MLASLVAGTCLGENSSNTDLFATRDKVLDTGGSTLVFPGSILGRGDVVKWRVGALSLLLWILWKTV